LHVYASSDEECDLVKTNFALGDLQLEQLAYHSGTTTNSGQSRQGSPFSVPMAANGINVRLVPKKLRDPSTLAFAHTPVEHPSVYQTTFR
jgi:hypothetical protein